MYFPGQALSRDVVNFILEVLKNKEIKAALHNEIRIEMDNERTKTTRSKGFTQSYDSLISGDVNMQARMAASSYDVYGRTVLTGNGNASNQSTYQRMKNKIKYGKSPEKGYVSHGQRTYF